MDPETLTIPFHLEHISGGDRPIITGLVNGIAYRLQIHSNAGMYLQTSHQIAALAKVTQLQHAGSYGIVSSGQLSTLGRDEGILSSLAIGDRTWRDVPVSVFETTGGETTGMLGLKWIEENMVLMDFQARVMHITNTVPPHPVRGSNVPSFQHYHSLPMRHDEATKRYLVDVKISSVTRPMIVSTVAGAVVDVEFARAAGIEFGPTSGESGGPTGTVQQRVHFAAPVELSIADWVSQPLQGEIEDIYAYMGQARPASGVTGGMLGADFLVANEAIVNFGECRLYLAKRKE